MESVPGSGSDRVAAYRENRDCEDDYPVATAPGTDLILKLRHYSLLEQFSASEV